jgi:hypothetical protein
MPGVLHRVSTLPPKNPDRYRLLAGLEPMLPALARGVIFLISVSTPFVVTLLLSR